MRTLAQHGVDWESEEDLMKLADGWGTGHLRWLVRFLRGEIYWLPVPNLHGIMTLLELSLDEERLLEELNLYSYTANGSAACDCTHCRR